MPEYDHLIVQSFYKYITKNCNIIVFIAKRLICIPGIINQNITPVAGCELYFFGVQRNMSLSIPDEYRDAYSV